SQGVRRRRHAPRPVAGGLGDPRRAPVRPRDRQVPDGLDRAAAVIQNSYRKNEKKLFGRAACAGTVGFGAVGFFGAPPAATAAALGAATVVSGAGFITGIGAVVVATIGSAPTGATPRRGQAKSSARPAGAVIGSPLTSTRVTDFGTWAASGSRLPISS